MEVSINVRVLGYINTCPEAGKIEFTIIRRKTYDGFNTYTALLDNGTVCPCYYENGIFTAWELPF